MVIGAGLGGQLTTMFLLANTSTWRKDDWRLKLQLLRRDPLGADVMLCVLTASVGRAI